MANFEEAYRKVVLQHEGTINNEDVQNDKVLLCAKCFKDEGLVILAFKIGIPDESECPSCKSSNGYKLTKKLVRNLCREFFVRGTIYKLDYGGFPLVQFNEQNFGNSSIDVSPWLENDVKLIEQAGEIGLFYYSPRFWMLGEIEPLKSLQITEEQDQIIDRILNLYPVFELSEKNAFYRIRLNPKVPYDISEYDSAPDEFIGSGRLDDKFSPILYGSPDLELCLHECRASVEDDIYVAKLVPKRKMNVLNLSALIDDSNTEFESLDIAIHFLFLASKHSYPITKKIAAAAKKAGFDGVIYPSFFSYIRTGHVPFDTVYGISIRRIAELKEHAESQIVPNLALFGRPIKDEILRVDSINKVVINRIGYDLSFGPAYHKAFIEEEETNDDDLNSI